MIDFGSLSFQDKIFQLDFTDTSRSVMVIRFISWVDTKGPRAVVELVIRRLSLCK